MNQKEFEWAIIGAGPAGIAALGNLLDLGVSSQKIVWIDPEFSVGDFGTKWREVSSNTSVKLFFDYFNFCESFEFKKAPRFEINQLDPEETCRLKYAAEPLKWITDRLLEKVERLQGKVHHTSMSHNLWRIKTKEGQEILSKNMILAIGSHPHSLAHQGVEEIPIEVGLDKSKLERAVQNKKRVAVFGSSHTAVILIRDLLDLGIEVDNYYQAALRYAVFFKDWILFDDTGLKGKTAEWARAHLHGFPPKGLKRYLSHSETVEKHLKSADAVLYATGFRRRPFHIEGLEHDFYCNPHCGIIAPGAFRLGIAFPELKIDRYGHSEFRVGLWKFMEYTARIMPLWFTYGL